MSTIEQLGPSAEDLGLPHGVALLRDPLLNKGTAFTQQERDLLGLRGLLPANLLTLEQQAYRVMKNLRHLPDDLEKYVALNALHDRNETLFFRVLCDNIDEIQPLVYTPTVGLACQRFGHIFQRPRGIFITADDKGRIAGLLGNWPYRAKLIVVTDGERILGLGDLGANGMGIPVGKLSLYSACAGVHPKLCLPVMLERRHQQRGTAERSRRRWPAAASAARAGVRRTGRRVHRGSTFRFPRRDDRVRGLRLTTTHFGCCANIATASAYSNDDIQGTAAVALAGILSSLRITGGKLTEQKLLFLGVGGSRHGDCGDLVVSAMVAQGLTPAQARERNWLLDSQGLVIKGRGTLAEQKFTYAHPHTPIGEFAAAIRALKPTAIIGVAAVGGTFTPDVS